MGDTSWQLFVYRLPAEPSRVRVAVWRALRRLGALPLGQAILALPDLGDLAAQLDEIEQRIDQEGGTSWRFPMSDLSPKMDTRLTAEWNALRSHEYSEIVEECQTKFKREIEFELFRGNLTAAESEEIEADLDKIKAWLARVVARDWFEAEGRTVAEAEVVSCEEMLNDFTEKVFLAESQEGPVTSAPREVPWGSATSSDD